MLPVIRPSVYSRATVAGNTQLHNYLRIIYEATLLSETVASNKVALCIAYLRLKKPQQNVHVHTCVHIIILCVYVICIHVVCNEINITFIKSNNSRMLGISIFYLYIC